VRRVGSVDAVSEPAPEPEGPGEEGRDGDGPDRPDRIVVTRRRAPRYRAFGATGAVIGVAVGLVLGLVPELAGDYTRQAIAGYFATTLGLVGALLGLGVALLVERRR
jgi:hypothetical protein